jgi:hypothetical protein
MEYNEQMLARAQLILKASKVMREACIANHIPYAIFEETMAVSYRALKRDDPKRFAEIDSMCDAVDETITMAAKQ